MTPKLARRKEPEYYLRLTEEDAEDGPFSIEILREMARAGEIERETWFRPAEATEFRPLGDDGPLAADLWPEEEAFDPEEHAVTAAGAESNSEAFDDGDGNVAGLLGDNIERERAARRDAGEPEPPRVDWHSALPFSFLALRWLLGLTFVALGARTWMERDDSPMGFMIGLILVVVAICLTLPETLRLVTSPITSLFDTLLEGSGGGKTADYWTADALLEQGEYRLAATEYRRIIREHPTELKAYLNGIRAARGLDNQKEAEQFRELAMKNLKTDQDRNLFLNSLERMQ